MFQLYGMKMIPVPLFLLYVAFSVVGGAGLRMGYRRRFGFGAVSPFALMNFCKPRLFVAPETFAR